MPDSPVPFIIAYGSETVPRHIRTAGAGIQADALSRPTAPAVALNPGNGAPLRLFEVRHPFSLPPQAQDLSHADRQLAALETHLVRLCGPFASPAAAFVTAYFAALRDFVAGHAGRLAERTGDLAGLVEPLHWAFAAPMPLPRAHLGLAPDGRFAGSGVDDALRLDILFQDSRGLLAPILRPAALTPGRRRAIDRLEAAGLRTVVLDPLPGGAALLAALGPDFADPTAGVALARSPFRGTPIAAPVS